MTSDRRPLTRWVVAAAAIVPAALAVIAARVDRPTVGPDAVSYIAVADSLRTGGGLGFFLERPLTTWPPLWPALIAVGETITGWRGDLVALAMNVVLLALVVVAGSHLAGHVLERRSVRYVLLAGLAVSPMLIGLGIIVQTEIAFVLGATLSLILILHGIAPTPASPSPSSPPAASPSTASPSAASLPTADRSAPLTGQVEPSSSCDGSRTWFLAGAGAVLAVCFYVRYQAFYAVPILGGWLLVRTWMTSRSLRRTAVATAAFVLTATVPSAIWMVRNLVTSDTIMGPRFPSDRGLANNVADGFATLAKFVSSLPTGPASLLALLGVSIVAVVVVTLALTGEHPGPRTWWLSVRTAFLGPVGLLVTFVVGFSCLMAATRSVVGFDDLDIRLLAPCMIPVSILFLHWAEVVLLDSSRWAVLGRVAIGTWLALQAVVTLLLLGPANAQLGDTGYNAPRAVAAATSPALARVPDGCVLYSNNAGDLYRGGTNAELSPRKVEYKSDQRTNDLRDLQKAVDGGQAACLAWVGYTDDDEVYSREELSTVVRLVQLGASDGVTVYRMEPRT